MEEKFSSRSLTTHAHKTTGPEGGGERNLKQLLAGWVKDTVTQNNSKKAREMYVHPMLQRAKRHTSIRHQLGAFVASEKFPMNCFGEGGFNFI